jgi:hypothetical protein
VLYTPELAARAEAWAAQPLTDKRSAEGLLELATIWAAINQVALPECIRQCQYSERAASLRAYILEFSRFQTPAIMSESTYQIAPQFANEKLVHEGYNKVVDASNLTDEDVKYFQKIGRKDLFVKRGSAAAEATETEVVDVDPEKPLVPQADLEAEQTAHAATKTTLEAEKQGYERVLADYNKANASRIKAEDSLKAEKEAHKGTKKELSEVQKQLAEMVTKAANQPTTPEVDAADAK